MFKYCPFCGGKLATLNNQEHPSLKFCPFCGEKLTGSSSNDEHKSSQSTKEQFLESEHYSIILKSCSDRQLLARRLEKLLVRSYLAIRMAVETIPCTIIYKGKVDDMFPIIEIFELEKANISVIMGDFNVQGAIEDIFIDFATFGSDVQKMLKSISSCLWVGDVIYRVIADVYMQTSREDHHGVLVITDQALYILYKEDKLDEYRYEMITYFQLATVQKEKAENQPRLAITYKDSSQEVFLTIQNDEQLTAAYEYIGKAIQTGPQVALLLKTTCTKCKDVFKEDIEAAAQKPCCVVCGEKYKRKLLKKK